MADINPAQELTDEELDAALADLGLDDGNTKEEGDDKKPKAPAKSEDGKSEDATKSEEEQPKGDEPKEGEEEGDTPKQPSRREQLRVQDLLKKYTPKEEPKAPAPKAPETGFDIDKDLDADDELKGKLKEAVQTAYEQGKSQSGAMSRDEKTSLLFHTRLEVDAPKIEGKYQFLDKDNEKFNPVLAKAINSMYLNSCGYDFNTDTVTNPNIRYADFVEALFELGDEIGTNKAATTAKAVAKQAAQTGPRPGGATAKPKLNLNKLPHEMSDEELDAKIASMVSSK